ncbi:MAG: ATP synthase F1 subunit delta [Desulfobacterales bacterium]
MKNLAVARRYAKALLLIGVQDGQAETYRSELQRVAGLVAGDSRLEQAIVNPLYDSAARRRVLQSLIAKMNLSRATSSFLLLLHEKGRFGFLNSISELYQKLADELGGIGRATVTAAHALPADAVERIRAALSRRTGKDIVLEVNQDPGLIGGIITRIGDLVLDGSIKTQLLNMRELSKRGEGA